MNDQDKIAELTAEIDRLGLVLVERQVKIGQLMGEAARAGIAGAPAELAAPINLPTNDEVYAEVCRLRESNFYISTNACYDVMHAARRLVASAPTAPLPELTGPSLTQAARLMLRDAANKLVNCGSIYDADKNKLIAELRGLADAASPSPAPAKQQEPSADQQDAARWRYMRGCCERDDVPGDVCDARTGAQLDHAIDAAISESGGSIESVKPAAPGASIGDKQ